MSEETDARISSGAVRHTAVKSRLTPAVFAVLINLAVWHVGVYLDSYGGWVDRLGAALCTVTYLIALLLVPATLVAAVHRRLSVAKAGWDFNGPALAIISVMVISWETERMTRY